MSRRRGPQPTVGIRIKLDFVLFFHEEQESLPLHQKDVNAMATALGKALSKVKGVRTMSSVGTSMGMDQRFTKKGLAKILKDAEARKAAEGSTK